jgi:hypothetical protein
MLEACTYRLNRWKKPGTQLPSKIMVHNQREGRQEPKDTFDENSRLAGKVTLEVLVASAFADVRLQHLFDSRLNHISMFMRIKM